MSLRPESQRLFDDARRDLSPTPDDARRNFARLMTTVAAGAAVSAPAARPSTVGASGAETSAFVAAGKIFIPIALVIGAGAITAMLIAPKPVRLESNAPSATHVASTAALPPTSAAPRTEPDAPALSIDALPVTPSASMRPRTTVEVSQAASSRPLAADDLVAEVALVRKIHDAQAAEKNEEVMRLTQEHAQRFPNGRLVEEREAARAIARCRESATTGESGARAEVIANFARAYPQSSHLVNVRKVCGDAR